MKVDVKQTVRRVVEDRLVAEGYELADAIVSQYRNNVTVRLFVYGKHGVSIDECARLSKIMGELLDENGLFDDGYALEISSPGLDRPLTRALDYKYRVGETVRLEFAEKDRKKIRGEIIAAAEDRVELRVDEELITVDLADIKQAQIMF